MGSRTLWGAAVLAVVSALAAGGVAEARPLPQHHYVASVLQLPLGPDGTRLGRNMDADPGPDNALGQVITALAQQGLDVAAMQTAAVDSGQLLMLGTLRSSSLANSKAATWQVRYAVPTAEPDFSGAGTFTVDPLAPRSARIPATIRNHHVSTSAATIPVSIQLGTSPINVPLQKARVFATCTSATCTNGRVNGAILKTDVDSVLVPGLAQIFQALVTRDCPMAPACTDQSAGQTILALFDSNHDNVISADELLANPLVQNLLAPDVDLLNAQGSPGHDGKADAISFGVGFTAVHATLG